jgi:catechol-2,3-dioxygenase
VEIARDRPKPLFQWKRHQNIADGTPNSSVAAFSSHVTPGANTSSTDMKLEIVVIPVCDVDRAKRFYAGLGGREDTDFASSNEFRVIQFTLPRGCS